MDSIFGIALTTIMVSLLVALGGIAIVIVLIAYRNPLLVRMGLRNAARRKAQTALIVFGLMLSTLIISASFTTGDTVSYSITEDVYRSFEQADIVVQADADRAPGGVLNESDFAAIGGAFDGSPEVEAISPALRFVVPAVNEHARRADPGAELVGLDRASIEPFQGLQTPGGRLVSLADLGEGQAFITERLANRTGLEEGSVVTAYVDGLPHHFEIAGILRDTVVTFSPTAGVAGPFEDLSGRIVVDIETAREIAGTPGAFDVLFVSLPGDVRDTVERIPAVEERLEALFEEAGIPAEILVTKERGVSEAELIGNVFMTIFLVLGLFSIAAGILLIFLIFVMLAAERRQEMGISRAVGMKRLHLTETFLAEGLAYNLGSALVGVALGVAVAFGLVTFMMWVWSDFELQAVLSINPAGLVVAYGLGVVITFITVTGAAWRAANLNIVTAMRDLPDAAALRGSSPSIKALGLSMAGVLWYIAWIGLVGIWVLFAIPVFFVGLATYGAGFAGGALVVGFYVYGARAASGPFREIPGWWRRGLYLTWWVAFSALAIVTWFLFQTREWANRHRSAGGWAAWMLVGGVALTYLGGWQLGALPPYRGGITLTVLAVAMLAVHFGLQTRLSFTIASLGLLWYWVLPLPFSLFTDIGARFDPLDALLRLVGLPRPMPFNENFEMFFVSGIAMVTAATLFTVFNADLLLWPVDRLGGLMRGIAPAVRTAVAYPLASRVRTGMTLSMFGLVIFSLTFMSFLTHNFAQFVLHDEARAGFDAVVTGNEANRIDDLRVALRDAGYDADAAISGTGTLVQGDAGMAIAAPGAEPVEFRLRGLDDEYLQLAELPLDSRAAGFESDADVFRAMRDERTIAVANRNVLEELASGGGEGAAIVASIADGFDTGGWEPAPVVLAHPVTGAETRVLLAGILSDGPFELMGWDMRGLFVHESAFEVAAGRGTHDSFFITVAGGVDTGRVAAGIESALLERGVTAQSLEEVAEEIVSQVRGIWMLFEAFMGLGLVVGIAALGVIAFRTVVERRQEIGMLRAIGYPRRLIAASFFFEWSFIALTGIVIGIVLGAALSHTLLTGPDFPLEELSVPWFRLLLVAGVAYGASALMTIIPTHAATKVPVAEALRYE